MKELSELSGTWLVVAAFRAELPRGIGRGVPVAMQAIGRTGGPVAVIEPPAGACALIVTGTCGALGPGFRPGALVAPERVILPGTGEFQPDARLHDALLAAADAVGLSVARGALVEATSVVDRPGARRELAQEHEASFVDMESATLAREARRLGLPWAILRFVSDSPERPLDWLAELLGGMPAEEPGLARLAFGLARRPWHAGRLIALGRCVHEGRRAVGRVVEASRRRHP